MSTQELVELQTISTTLKRIERTLGEKSSTTNETRIGALRRISEAVETINFLLQSRSVITRSYHLNALEKIKDILLGVIKEVMIHERKDNKSIYLDEETSKKLKSLADSDNRSFNSYINIVLANHLKGKRVKPKLIKKRSVA